MSDSVLTEGWPKTAREVGLAGAGVFPWDKVVPLSDAERLREALEWIAESLTPGECRESGDVHLIRSFQMLRDHARAALNPERGGNALGEPIRGAGH